ncbi:DOMON-like domain-containing protein [Sphingomonas sp. R1]|uniref:DOMON-like domain-containing protein n=1 Tax=Sphingomonas sp. R1 TaxID=399176 RepID=UPI0022246318|nr:DOMON-like domain-containing protein [Sphingomonas sp. R1]UYY78316.1 DOMON-like domain-containing protein [Sphingomonas sp. R1]
MEWSLYPHPARPAASMTALTCSIERDAAALNLVYRVEGAHGALHLPDSAAPLRTDGLWATTCLELFVADAGGAYREFNFSPSGQWAAYRFTAPRAGMAPLAMHAPPAIRLEEEGGATILSVHLPGVGAGALRLGITAVIEELDGTKSYWALQHGADAPDFHDPDCFVAQLPPAD